MEAADEMRVSMIAIPCPLEFDVNLLKEHVEGKKIVVVEDHGWFGLGAVLSYKLMKNGISVEKFEHVAIDSFTESGSWKDIYKIHKLDKDGIVEKIKEM